MLRLVSHQVIFTNKAFWRNPVAAFFTFAFPLMFLVLFGVLFSGGTSILASGREVPTTTFFVPAIAAFSVVNACYTSIAMSVTFARDNGVLKRVRGTPLPSSAYFAGRVLHATFVALILVGITIAFGAFFYGVSISMSTLPSFVVVLAVGAATFSSLALAIVPAIPNAHAAPAVVNGSILPLLFISNVFIPLHNPPGWLDAFSRAFPVRHFADALIAAFLPHSSSPALRIGDLAFVAAWGLLGVILAVRFFDWEPR
ncbi:MAG: ABC transporter permease [Acidimicrobiia bacterium]